jgi:2'-5' RNA ligase
MSVFRAFIAVSLSQEIHHNLAQVIDSLKKKMPGSPVRWVQAGNIHLTLKFLGDVSISNQELLTKVLLTEVSRHPSFELSVGELGVFPTMRRPKVIWVGVEAPQELFALQRGLESEMARLGYAPEERPFSPHLTLGRISRNAVPGDFQVMVDALSSCKVGFLGAVRVQTVELYRSDLKPTGAVYTRLFSAALQIDKSVQSSTG